MDLKPLINRLADGDILSREETHALFLEFMEGNATPAQVAAVLMAMRVRGEGVEEIVGAALAMRDKVVPVALPPDTMDIVGTGGDYLGTFNISTACAFVVSGAGIPVAKHGNRAASSRSGASDVLTALGVNVANSIRNVERCLEEIGLGFLLATKHHGAMRHVAPVRQEMGTRTIFNLLGPLSNPGRAKRQLMGVASGDWLQPLAEVLGALGLERAWLVHGEEGMDEITTTGKSHVVEWKAGGTRAFQIDPAEYGFAYTSLESLKGGDAEENADALRAILSENPDRFAAYRDIVLLNSAAAIVVGGKADNLEEGLAIARKSIESGRAMAQLEGLVRITQEVN